MFTMDKPKAVAFGVFLLLFALIIACGEESTPTATATAAPAATPDIGAAVQQAVQQAIAAFPTPIPGISAEDIPSIEDISSLVQAAVAVAAPEGTTPEQIRSMVQAAVQAAAQPGVTRADLEAVVQSAVEEAVSEAVSQITPIATAVATPVATPTPTLTATPVAKVEPTGILRVAMVEVPPFTGTLRNQSYFYSIVESRLTNETLMDVDSEERVNPRLAKRWTIDPSGLVYTLYLQENVPWHDNLGDWGEFNADDLIFSVQNITAEGAIHNATTSSRRLWACEGCKLVKLDEMTVELTRPTPTIELTWQNAAFTTGPLTMHSKKHFDAVGEGVADQQSVGTGPWRQVGYTASDFGRFEALRDHWRKTPEWQELVWQQIAEESTRIASFLTDNIDTGQFSLDGIQQIKGENLPGVKYMSPLGGSQMGLHIFGLQHYPDHPAHQPGPGGEPPRVPLGEGAVDCSDPWVSCDRNLESEEWQKARKVRLAMALAMDRQKLVNNLTYGEGEPSYAYWWNGHPSRIKQFGLDKLEYGFDPERAKQLLVEAGYPDGFEIDMCTCSYTPNVGPVAQAVATMLENIGIRTRLYDSLYSSLRPKVLARTMKGMTPGSIGTQVEPVNLLSFLLSASGLVNLGFEHPVYQKLLDEVWTIYDEDARWAKQAEVARFIFDEVMAIPLYEEKSVWPLGPHLDPWALPGSSAAPSLANWEYAPHRK